MSVINALKIRFKSAEENLFFYSCDKNRMKFFLYTLQRFCNNYAAVEMKKKNSFSGINVLKRPKRARLESESLENCPGFLNLKAPYLNIINFCCLLGYHHQ